MTDEYLQNVSTDTENLLRDADAEVSAITGGVANQTVSARVALADSRDGKRWARAFCWFLSIMVQPDHCRATLSGGPMPWWVYPRAAFCFLFFIAGVPMMIGTGDTIMAACWFGGMTINAAVGWLLR